MKRVLTLVLALVMVLGLGTGVFAEGEKVEAIKSNQKLLLDGKDTKLAAYNIAGENYFKLRDLAAMLTGTEAAFNVIYDGEKDAIFLTEGHEYKKLDSDLVDLPEGNRKGVLTPQKVILTSLPETSELKPVDLKGYNIDDHNYFRLRDIGKLLNFGVAYDQKQNAILIDSANPDIQDVLAENGGQGKVKVVLYGRESCRYCVDAKKYLGTKGVNFEYKDLKEDPEAEKEFEKLGYSVVPVMVIGDEVIVGFSETKIDAALAKLK